MYNYIITAIKGKKKNLFILGCVILLCTFFNVNAQQIPLHSQYTFSPFALNPAATGADAPAVVAQPTATRPLFLQTETNGLVLRAPQECMLQVCRPGL